MSCKEAATVKRLNQNEAPAAMWDCIAPLQPKPDPGNRSSNVEALLPCSCTKDQSSKIIGQLL